jgi:hypothetical protein
MGKNKDAWIHMVQEDEASEELQKYYEELRGPIQVK